MQAIGACAGLLSANVNDQVWIKKEERTYFANVISLQMPHKESISRVKRTLLTTTKMKETKTQRVLEHEMTTIMPLVSSLLYLNVVKTRRK